MSAAALYTDLSSYYDLMCAGIDYRQQSEYVRRIHQLLGNGGHRSLDLGCGTGPHVRHFIDFGYQARGLDIHQPMLDIAQQRNPEASFIQGDMSSFAVAEPADLITCFLYSIHYNPSIARLSACLAAVDTALAQGGLFCFNAVDKTTIQNRPGPRETVAQADGELVFQSRWNYAGEGDAQQLLVRIEKRGAGGCEVWEDEHAMVAVDFRQLRGLLDRLFEVHVFEHVYDRIAPWEGSTGNAIFVCLKR